jgi:hypothetical protein
MKYITYYFLLLSLCSIQSIIAQSSFEDMDIISSYEDYAEMQREIVYLHLNKSTYIKGESIGLKAYVLDKASKRLSAQTSNLYCTISDDNDVVIKKKLIMVNNGVAINDFTLDSLFTSGIYKITAYTNWMKNFEEKNFFSQTVRVIDPQNEKEVKQLKTSTDIDAQFLPEGGHLVSNVETIIGATVKDEYGFGVPNLECEVVDSENNQITIFKLNQFGLGKFNLTPTANSTYKVKVKVDEVDYSFDLNTIESKGMGLKVSKTKDKTFITLKTNASTLESLQNKIYTLAIHNGNELKELNFRFGEELEIVKVISNSDLFSGINIITVLDASNTPLLERQIFNYDGISFVSSNEAQIQDKGDSLLVSIPYNKLNTTLFNNFSISVLPSKTRAYNHHENISSSILLQPYVKGYIENSNYYFESITSKKEYELDNLLLTQGWSSYDWDTIFNNPPDYDYDFENGIGYVANFSNANQQQLIIYPTLNSPIEIIELQAGEMAFEKQGFFPISEEEVKIGAIDKNGKPTKTNITLQFSPDVIPTYELADNYKSLIPREIRNSEMNNYDEFTNGLKKIEQLDEVILTGKREYTEVERIKNSTVGKVTFMDDRIKRRYKSILNFIDTKGFNAYLHPGSIPMDFVITNRTKISINASQSSVVYLNDVILQGDHGILIGMSLEDVEYIETNSSGLGAGMRGGGGVIKIKTNPFSTLNKPKQTVAHKSFEVPLKFDVVKRFYIPKYKSQTSNFFNEYGIIDWFSNVSTDANGVLNLKIYNNKQTNLKLFIEGFSDDGTFISEVKEIKVD